MKMAGLKAWMIDCAWAEWDCHSPILTATISDWSVPKKRPRRWAAKAPERPWEASRVWYGGGVIYTEGSEEDLIMDDQPGSHEK